MPINSNAPAWNRLAACAPGTMSIPSWRNTPTLRQTPVYGGAPFASASPRVDSSKLSPPCLERFQKSTEATRVRPSPVSEIEDNTTVQDLSVVFSSQPHRRLTSQNPESLAQESARLP